SPIEIVLAVQSAPMRDKLWCFALLFALCFSTRPSLAGTSGNELLEQCQRVDKDEAQLSVPEKYDNIACMAYMNGLADGITLDTHANLCVPTGVTVGQIL